MRILGVSKLRVWMALALAAGLSAGCGFEPPEPGAISVTSDPTDAAISLDGRDTGLTTPALLPDLDGGTYIIAVSKPDVVYRPAQRSIAVDYGRRTTVHFETNTGSLSVTSSPRGASILLDGGETGEVTPHTFDDLDPGEYTVDVLLPHHRSESGPQVVTVIKNAETIADFSLSIGTVVLFEGFSNVRCPGCPTMLGYIKALMATEGYGYDRLVFVKYAGSTPYGSDPMYLSNPNMVRLRALHYFGTFVPNLPSLAIRGAHFDQGWYPDLAGMRASVDACSAAPADFFLTVTAPLAPDLAVRDVEGVVAVHAPYADVDLSAYQLRAVLLYSEVHTAEAYVPGGSEYFWVARRDVVVAASIGEVTPAEPLSFTFTLSDPDPATYDLEPFGREIIVFVQHPTSKTVIQAGSTMIEARATTRSRNPLQPGEHR